MDPFDQNEFDEAYKLAMDMLIEKRGGDRSIVYQKLMENAPSIGMVVEETEGVYEGRPGRIIWDYGLCNEITFMFDGDDPDDFIVLYTAKDEYDAELAFNHYYKLYKPEGAPDKEFHVLSGSPGDIGGFSL
ncbi:MAG: hypothetical protein HFE90_06095 [Firmicutes bacterium]|nr:hypothetical protein [Bacillota bacterium]